MVIDKALVFGEVVVLSVALPLAVIAAFGFRGSPFGKVMAPIPLAIAAYIVADGSVLFIDPVPVFLYVVSSSVAILALVYATANAILLLTERRPV